MRGHLSFSSRSCDALVCPLVGSVEHQLGLQSVLPRDVIHVTTLTPSITRTPAVNLTDACTCTLVSECENNSAVIFLLEIVAIKMWRNTREGVS